MENKQFDNNNRGVLFKNDKQGNDNRPDYKGSINVNGVDMWLSCWVKTSAKGQSFMSLSVQAKDQQQSPAPVAQQQQIPLTNDGEIPF